MELCKDCGKEPREGGKVRCVKCSIRVWQRTVKKTARDKLRAIEYRGGKCERCGFDDRSILDLFDFHHLEDKDRDLSKMFGRLGWEKIKTEIEKCVLLCAMCHRREHYFIRKGEEQERLCLLPKKSTDWTEEDLEFLKGLDRHSMKQIRDVIPQYSEPNIQRKCKELGLTIVSHRDRSWTLEEVEELSNLTQKGRTIDEIHKLLKTRSRDGVVKKQKELGIYRRYSPYLYDAPFIDFEEMTKEKAYLLGLIWGLGGLSTSGDKVYITMRKREHREAIRRFFNLRETKNRLWIDHWKSVSQIAALGLRVRLNYVKIPYPSINKTDDVAFIRGFFDARSIITKKGTANIIFCGNSQIVLAVNQKFKDYYPHQVFLRERERTSKGHKIKVSELTYGQVVATHFLEFIKMDLDLVNERYQYARNRLLESRNTIWTEEELDLLRNNYGKLQNQQLLRLFPNRNWWAVQYQINKLGLKKTEMRGNKWTIDELAFLKQSHQTRTREEIINPLQGRHSKDAVYTKMLELGVSPKEVEKRSWDLEIIERIKLMKRDGYRVTDMSDTLGLPLGDVKQYILYLRKTLTYEERIGCDLLSLKERREVISGL